MSNVITPKTPEFDEWLEEFNPVINPKGDECIFINDKDCITFGTNSSELQDALKTKPDCVWTIVEADNPDYDPEDEDDIDDTLWVICDGYSWVNRLGYIITDKPCPKDESFEITYG